MFSRCAGQEAECERAALPLEPTPGRIIGHVNASHVSIPLRVGQASLCQRTVAVVPLTV